MSDMTSGMYPFDADMFAAIHESICREAIRKTRGQEVERRRYRRYPFPTIQLAAYVPGQSLPTIDQLQTVQCRDISSGGFSFFSDNRPACDSLIVILRQRSDYLYLTGEIIHVSPIIQQEHGQLVVGCQFTGRVFRSQDLELSS